VSGDGGPAAYDEGERVLGPPTGTYDADWVAQAARTADPGLPEETARELAIYAWEHLREIGELDAPEVARRLLVDHKVAGASAATVVAKAAVDFCQDYDVPLG
jgi:hypothetical protein